MSDLIRTYTMVVSHDGTCRKCGQPRTQGSHRKCDRWPGGYSAQRGLTYIGNSSKTTLGEFRRVVEAICAGDDDSTPVQFEIRIRQRE